MKKFRIFLRNLFLHKKENQKMSENTRDVMDEIFGELMVDTATVTEYVEEKSIQNVLQASTSLLQLRRELAAEVEILKPQLEQNTNEQNVEVSRDKLKLLLREEAIYTMVVEHATKVGINIPLSQRN
jgi:hypothetical protein